MSDLISSLIYRHSAFLHDQADVGDLKDYLDLLSLDFVEFYDDFLGQSINDTHYNLINNGTGAANAAIPATGALNGTALMDAGSDDDGYSGLALQLNFEGESACVMAVRLQLSAITSVKCEVGFTDALADAGAVNALATPTYTATDAALWIVDTDDDANWQGIGVDSGTGITKVEPGSSYAPVAATYQTLMVALSPDQSGSVAAANFLIFNNAGKKRYESGWQASAITNTVDLTPWVFVQNRSANQRTATLDYIRAWQRRSN